MKGALLRLERFSVAVVSARTVVRIIAIIPAATVGSVAVIRPGTGSSAVVPVVVVIILAVVSITIATAATTATALAALRLRDSWHDNGRGVTNCAHIKTHIDDSFLDTAGGGTEAVFGRAIQLVNSDEFIKLIFEIVHVRAGTGPRSWPITGSGILAWGMLARWHGWNLNFLLFVSWWLVGVYGLICECLFVCFQNFAVIREWQQSLIDVSSCLDRRVLLLQMRSSNPR